MFCIYVERCFESLICWLDLWLSSHLVAFSSYVFFSLEKPLFCILNSFSTDTSFIKISGFDLDNFSTNRPINRGWLLLDRFSTPPRSIEIPLHAFHFYFILLFFPFVSIVYCFSFSWRSMVHCSPRSLYISFLFVSSQVFWPFMPFDNRVKKGENFENWMSFLRGSNRLRWRTSC